ncbi:MAG TPA: phage tail protein [Pyrinomonadaceae bacterium]
MPTETTFQPSGLLQYLPAIYQEDAFVGQFLLAFEKILLGRTDSPDTTSSDPDLNPKGLEQIIDGLSQLYDPLVTPDEFLPWLSKWTALSLRADMTLEQQRRFIAQIIQLYEYRGTQANLIKLLELFLTATPAIEVREADPPYFFRVRITLPRKGAEIVIRQREIAQALIELEKPAHTDYTLTVNTPTLKIGQFSTVGVDTLLGTTEE